MRLVIAEKPSVAKSLAAVLGTERGDVAALIRQSWPGWPEKLPEPVPAEM